MSGSPNDDVRGSAARDIRAGAGLCGQCVYAVVRPTRRGTTYLRCGLARADSRFPKYPRLPISACDGYEQAL